MIDIKTEVMVALEEIDSVKVFFYFPEDFVQLPCISYCEANNAPFKAADDTEYLSEIIYSVDVWGKSSGQVTDIAIAVNEKLTAIGFYREFSQDIRKSSENTAQAESNVRHKAMRFKLIK